MKNLISLGSTIGIIGGGQLGRMMIHAASRLGYPCIVYCDQPNSPACDVAARSMIASYLDEAALKDFAALCSVVTFEFENIPQETVKILHRYTRVVPDWKALHISQNRLREKEFVNSLGIDTAPFRRVTDESSLMEAVSALELPCLLKTTEMGYDGKGQFLLKDRASLKDAWNQFSSSEGIVEKWVPFKLELSIVAARGNFGDYQAFDPVQNIHRDGILDLTLAPADISLELAEKARAISQTIMEQLNYVGVLAAELFVTQDDHLLLNEIAPRPHNSGHWTIDACLTNQFEQHIRAICGLPLGDPSCHSKAKMKNLIGADVEEWASHLHNSRAKIHIYGKKECKPGRKMGHVTELYSHSE